MMMFPTAQDIDDAKKQYIYVSQAAPLEELKEARDWACGSSPQSLATATPARTADGAGPAETPGLETPAATEQAAKESGSSASGGDGCDGKQIKVGQTVTGRIGRAGGWNTYCIRVEQGLIYLFDASWDGGIPLRARAASSKPTSTSRVSTAMPSSRPRREATTRPRASTKCRSGRPRLLHHRLLQPGPAVGDDDHSNDGETATSWGQTIHGSHEYPT